MLFFVNGELLPVACASLQCKVNKKFKSHFTVNQINVFFFKHD